MGKARDFFANDPFPPAVPYRDPVEVEAECRYLELTRWLALELLAEDPERWRRQSPFRELCALIAVNYAPDVLDPRLPEVPAGFRELRPEEIIEPTDRFRPVRIRPSYKTPLRLPLETVQPGLVGKAAGEWPTWLFVRKAEPPL